MPETARLTDDPKKSKPLPDLTGGKAGDNLPDADTIKFFAGLFRKDQEAIKAAQAAFKKTKQRYKLQGGRVGALIKFLKVGDQEDETYVDELKELRRIAQAHQHPLGEQLQLFDLPSSATNQKPSETPEEYADRIGYDHGLMARTPDEQAFPPALPEGQAYMKGWYRGQDVHKQKFLKLNEEPVEAPKKRGRKKNGATENGHADGE